MAKTSDIPFEVQNPTQITLFKHPLITLKYFIIVIFEYILMVLQFVAKYWYFFVMAIAAITTPYQIEGPHTPFLRQIEEMGYFMAYWVLLGVASSIGLGTGLHTFVLYLGPWIAKVTLVAYECQSLPVFLPNKWNFEKFADCPANPPGIGFVDILMSVQFEAFLWGFGTALGELPPYFVAKAAAASKKKVEELEEMEQEKDDNSFIARAKRLIFNNLQKYGFITVLICASIPNPLFDLAGITCGHFGIPFLTFFGATAIGKSIIKTHIQMVFVIFMFSQQMIDKALLLVGGLVPSLQSTLSEMLEKNKKALYAAQVDEGEKPIVAQLWDWFILAMISYFLLSIVNSLVQGHLEDKKQALKNKKK